MSAKAKGKSKGAEAPDALRLHGISFEPPPGFATDEVMLSMRAGGPASAAPGPRAAQPSLVVHGRPARAGSDVAMLAGEVVAELTQAVGGTRDLSTVDFEFDDGARGILIAYDFPAAAGREVLRQYHAVRLDGERLTTITLTVPRAQLTTELGETYLRSLGSARAKRG